MRRARVFLLVAAGLMAGVLLIGLMGSAVPVAANPDIRIDVNYGHNWVYVNTSPTPFTDVTITVSDSGGVKGTYDGQTDGNGELWTQGGGWNPDGGVQILPGDIVLATAGIDSTTVNPVGTINGALDITTDTIVGTINAPFATVGVSCQIWVENGPPSIDIPDVSGNGGSYTCDFSGIWDIVAGQNVAVRYVEPDGDGVINMMEPPAMRVNYAHDWVGGNYPAGLTFNITVKDSLDAVKATAVVESTPGGGWGSDGFETQDGDWVPERPDIVAGDSVQAVSGTVYDNTVKVGDIGGTLDLVGNKISGPINASWLSATLPVDANFGLVQEVLPGKDSTAAPDGTEPYECIWNPITEWKIQPGTGCSCMVPGTGW